MARPPVNPHAAAVLRAAEEGGQVPYHLLSPAAARSAMRLARAKTSPPPIPVRRVETFTIKEGGDRLFCRLYQADAGDVRTGLVVFLHGGGWVLGDLDTHDGLCRHLASASGHAVLAVDYRLAPEHPFPAALDDAVMALRWAHAHADNLEIDPDQITVCGDSAGGNLAAVLALMARAGAVPSIAAQVLLYPVLDLRLQSESFSENAEGYFLSASLMRWFREHYARGLDPGDWRLSPICAAEFSGLPPAFVLTAGYDPCRDDGRAYASRLALAGVDVALHEIGDQIHGFMTMGGVIPRAAAELDRVSAWLRAIGDDQR